MYFFGAGANQEVYISSADWMTRNTLHRVEVALPVLDPSLRARLAELFALQLRDDCQARALQSDGSYVRVRGEAQLNSQEYFYDRACERAGKAP